MPAISFNKEFLDALLRGDKQQTTRKQTDRIQVGDICHIYIEQRGRIMNKPLMRLTDIGFDVMRERHSMMTSQIIEREFYAHFLGKVKITGVHDIRPSEMSREELAAWALADGFSNFDPIIITPESIDQSANWWFSYRYGNDWMQQMWTVIRWDGWTERYFEPKP